MRIYTIGHSTKSEFELGRILKKHNVKVLVDIRSIPYSKYNPQFNRFHVAKHLESEGVQYIWKGKNLGGKGGKEANVDYDKNLDWLMEVAETENVCIMCSESDYKTCHRWQMIQQDVFLKDDKAEMFHIDWKGNDTIETAKTNSKKEVAGVQIQQSLFRL